MKNEVDVTSLDRRFDSLSRDISAAAHFFLEALDKKNTYTEIYLVNNGQMRKLNNEYRGEDTATNVLSFTAPKDFPNAGSALVHAGEIYISPTYADSHGDGMNYLLLHGILHLFGFNHENKSDRMRMEKLEKKIIALSTSLFDGRQAEQGVTK